MVESFEDVTQLVRTLVEPIVENPEAATVTGTDQENGEMFIEIEVDEGDIGNVAVAPDSRRRGIGAALLKALFAESERRGAAVLQLEVRESNLAARRLYEKNGFEIVGKRKNYYEKPAEDAILMSKFFQKEAE